MEPFQRKPLIRDQVILVDEYDRPLGLYPKLAAHEEGLLHRAISVFVRDRKGRLLMQKRATGKYHSGGLWSNACCTHPCSLAAFEESGDEFMASEMVEACAQRRVEEELGLRLSEVRRLGHVHYRVDVGSGLTEHEFTHVLEGVCDDPGSLRVDPSEVEEIAWMAPQELEVQMRQKPAMFSAWLPHVWGVYTLDKK